MEQGLGLDAVPYKDRPALYPFLRNYLFKFVHIDTWYILLHFLLAQTFFLQQRLGVPQRLPIASGSDAPADSPRLWRRGMGAVPGCQVFHLRQGTLRSDFPSIHVATRSGKIDPSRRCIAWNPSLSIWESLDHGEHGVLEGKPM